MAVVFNQNPDGDFLVVGEYVVGTSHTNGRTKIAVEAPREVPVLRGDLVRRILSREGWLIKRGFRASNGVEELSIMEALKRCGYEPKAGVSGQQ